MDEQALKTAIAIMSPAQRAEMVRDLRKLRDDMHSLADEIDAYLGERKAA